MCIRDSFEPNNEMILGAHMLEVCPTIASSKPRIEVHPLSIGAKADPARIVFLSLIHILTTEDRQFQLPVLLLPVISRRSMFTQIMPVQKRLIHFANPG